MHLGGVAAVHRRERRPLGAGLPLRLDVCRQGRQVAGRADDDADGHVDVEDLVQQVGECQRGQGIPTEVGEVRVGLQVGCRRTQQRARGPADGLQYRSVGAMCAQFPQLVGLAVGQVGVELFEPLAVVLLGLRPRELADAGEQTVLQRERRCLDDEIAGNLKRLQPRSPGDILQRLGDQRLQRLDVVAGKCIGGRHDHGQQVRAGAVAVDEDLPDQWAVAEQRFQLGDGDELALRELEHVVAAVEIRELVRSHLCHDVTGAVVAVDVEHVGGDLRSLVVPGENRRGLDQQLTTGMGPVGAEVAEVGDVDELVVDDRRTLHVAVDEDRAGLGRAVAVGQMDV